MPIYGENFKNFLLRNQEADDLETLYTDRVLEYYQCFHMELLWDGGRKVCSKGPGHMTKMAAMLIYGRNLKKSSSLEPKGR